MELYNDKHPLPTKKIQKGYMVLTVFLFVIIFVPAVVHIVLQRNASLRPAQITDTLYTKEIAYFSDSIKILQNKRRNHYYAEKNYKNNYSEQNCHNGSPVTIGSKYSNNAFSKHQYYCTPTKGNLHFDLNQADSIDLIQLRGIGPSFARRIILYREKLGGYVNIKQLQEIYGMTEETYKAITPFLSVSSKPNRSLNPNAATLQQLRNHPYLNYYQARAIIDWRSKGHRYNTIEDLQVVPILDDSTITKIAPYLTF